MPQVAVDEDPAVEVLGDETDTLATGSGYIKNVGAQTAYLGGANVTAATGYPLAAAEELGPFPLGNSAKLYAICDTGESTTLNALVVGG